jgi:hypothetical protein
MRSTVLVAAAVLLAAWGSSGADPVAARADDAQPARLTIAFTGDVNGYLEPCG